MNTPSIAMQSKEYTGWNYVFERNLISLRDFC